jgi:hypothetical protein
MPTELTSLSAYLPKGLARHLEAMVEDRGELHRPGTCSFCEQIREADRRRMDERRSWQAALRAASIPETNRKEEARCH